MSVKSKPLSVITGGSGGIGRCLALDCASRGYNVALIDLNPESLKEVQTLLVSKYPNQLYKTYVCDVTNSTKLKQCVQSIKTDFNGSVELLFNNVGIFRPIPMLSSDLRLLHKMMNINFWSMVELTQLLLPLLKNSYSNGYKIARIINTSSVAGIFSAESMYHISKHAVTAYSETITHELKNLGLSDRIHCHVLIPAPTNTTLIQNTKKVLDSKVYENEEKMTSLLGEGIPPELVSKYVWYGIENDLTYIHTNWDWSYAGLVDRFKAISTGTENDKKMIKKALDKPIVKDKIIGPSVDNIFSKL